MQKMIFSGFSCSEMGQYAGKLEKMYKRENVPVTVTLKEEKIFRADSTTYHVIIGDSSGCPYIIKGDCDSIIARTYEDCIRNIHWLKDGGEISILEERKSGEYEREYSPEEMRKYCERVK